MSAARRGDAAAYRKLLVEVADVLRRVVSRRLARLGLGIDETEDIVQEVLIGLHSRRHSWDETRPFLPWLYAIVHYKFTDAARRLGRDVRRRLDIRPEDWDTLFAAPDVDLDRATLDIDRHLDRLPAAQRGVVRSLAVDGASVKATADRFRTTPGTIRMTLHRALASLSSAARQASSELQEAGKDD